MSAGGAAERLARLYATLSEVDEAIVRVRQRGALFERVCRVLVERGGLPLVWVGEIDREGSIVPVAYAGAAQGYVDLIRVSVHDVPEGRGPTGTAARERRHVASVDVATDSRMAPWRDAALARGLRSSAAFPLVLEDHCVAVVTAYASEPGYFDEQELVLFDRMAADLSFALEAMRRDEQRRTAEEQLRVSEQRLRVATESMLDTVTILAPVRDEDGEIVDFRYEYANPPACALVGLEREQLVGQRAGQLFPGFAGSERFDVYRRVAITGEPCRSEALHGQDAWSGTPLAERVLDTVIASMGDELLVTAHDITERKHTEQQLRLQAELLELAHDAVIVRDPLSGRVTFWNRAAETIYGYRREEAIGRVTHDLLKTEFPRSLQAVDDALTRAGRWAGRLRHTRKDGRVLVVSSRWALQRDQDGQPVAIIELNSDISERVRAEQQLAATAELLARTQQISKTGGWEYDLASGRLTWTDEVYRIYGIEQPPQRPEVAPAIAAFDARSAPVIEAAFERLVATGEPYDLELGLVRGDGEHVWVRTIGRPVIEDDRIVRVGGNITDITERRLAEEEIRALNAELEQRVAARTAQLQRLNAELEDAQRLARVGSYTWDPHAGVVTWSAHMYELFGRDPKAGPAVGDALLPYVHPDDRERVSERYELGADSTREFQADVRIITEQGEQRVLHVIDREDAARPGCYRGTFQDVSEQRRAERERLALVEQRTQAEAANRAKSEFLARMSHELRTPLNAIIGFGQVLALEDFAPQLRQDLGYILKAGSHLLELVNEVLDLAQVESGRLTISLEPVALADAISDALTLLAPLARELRVTLHTDTSALAGDGHVLADRQRFGQVLLNVIGNAIKYNRPGGRVDISFQVTNARVRTLIADTGIGIAPEHRAGLFEPFERLGAEQTGVEGTGLGLALSRRLIEAMGGTIDVDSTPGAGSTFTIELAETPPPSTQHPPTPDEDDLAELTSPDAPRRLILYIEDNLSNLTLVQRILARHDRIRLISAMQGTLGLELARQHHPDLVILDLHLPDIAGADVLKRLKADQPQTPVIVLTADASERQANTARSLGAADYLTKPLDVRRFLDTITTHLTPPDDTKPSPHAPA